MPDPRPSDAEIVATLNDLLQLDHDAVQAYTLAIKAVGDLLRRETLESFRGDHERHIRDLTPLIEARGGTPIQLSHVPTGAFKLAVQAVGAAGSDREVLLAFKANERQVRDKYLRRSGEEMPPDVAEVIARNAADEVKHYAWASEALEAMGAGEDTRTGKAEAAFEEVHKRAADTVEGAERRAMEQAERVRSRGASVMDEMERMARESPAQALALTLAAGLVLRKILR
jgi:ElaB/YqjD/DUF883 family membrane-anchored ribosome-binding protein